jgi:hypothetical protein
VVPDATGATRISRLQSISYKSLSVYEPRGREFESLQARQVINTYLPPMPAKPSGCVTFERLPFFQAIAPQYTGSSR